uniref:Microneme antigen 10 n=1 Tax=Sarcocystis neurona TaxID=42890 RepID=Q8MU96_SARNE|nr:microneme antigen 10 [Sarcocystis neurona]
MTPNQELVLSGAGCQWGIIRLLQNVFILGLLVFSSSVSGTTLNELGKNDDAAPSGLERESAYDSAYDSATDTSAAVEDDNQHRGEIDSSLQDGELASNVELKSIAPHTSRNAYNPEALYAERRAELARQTPAEVEKAKQQYREEQERKKQAESERRRQYGQVVQEMKVAAAAHQMAPKRSRIYSGAPSGQERMYQEQQAAAARVTPEQRRQAMEARQREVEEREKMRTRYGDVMAELKEKLAARAQRLEAKGARG